MANLLLKKGSYAEFKSKILDTNAATEGALYFTENEGGLYIGKSDGSVQRIQGTLHQYATLTDFVANEAPPYSQDVVYFIADKNALVRWDGTQWIQLNTSVETARALETRIKANEDKLKEHTTAISGNTTAITNLETALNADIEALEGRMTTAEGKITTAEGKITNLETEVGKKADSSTVNEISAQVGTNTTDIDTLKCNVSDLQSDLDKKAAASDLEALAGRVSTNETNIGKKADASVVSAIDTRLGQAETQLGTNTTDIGNLKTGKADASTVSALTDRVAENERDIAQLQTDVAGKVSQSNFDTLNTTVGEHSAAIAANAANIKTNSEAIAKKADKEALDAVSGEVTKVKGNITTINNTLSTKADNDTVNGIDTRLGQVESEVSGLTTDLASVRADAKAGKVLSTNDFTDDYAQKLEELQIITVDDALSTTSTMPVQNKVITGELNGVKSSIQQLESVQGNYVNKTDYNADIKDINDEIAAINDALGLDGTDGTISSRITALETDNTQNKKDIAANLASIGQLSSSLGTAEAKLVELEGEIDKNKEDIAANVEAIAKKADQSALTELSGKVSTNETNIAKKADQSTVDQISSEVAGLKSTVATKTYVDEEIDKVIIEANAMTYKGGVNSANELPDEASIGDTYVVTTAFDNYQPGDLLIAQGVEGENGIIGTITWDHVKSGYSDIHDPKLSAANNQIILKNFAETKELGVIEVASASDNITISTSGNTISVGLQWGTF